MQITTPLGIAGALGCLAAQVNTNAVFFAAAVYLASLAVVVPFVRLLQTAALLGAIVWFVLHFSLSLTSAAILMVASYFAQDLAQ